MVGEEGIEPPRGDFTDPPSTLAPLPLYQNFKELVIKKPWLEPRLLYMQNVSCNLIHISLGFIRSFTIRKYITLHR